MTASLLALFPATGGIDSAWRHVPDDSGLRLLVDGRIVTWEGPRASQPSVVVTRDADGGSHAVDLGPVALASAELGRAAVEAAALAWKGGRGEWPRASTTERIGAVEAFVRRARPLRDQVARALMWEVGKPYKDCLVEFDRTMAYVEDTIATLADLDRSSAAVVRDAGFAACVRRAPLGVCLCMGPYNYAVNEVYTLLIPALIMGNTVVTKTPRFGVLANAILAEALAASFPPGVVNLVTGDGATVVGPIMESGLVDVLAFIGSAKTARTLMRQHPHPNRLRTVLGLGAKNTALVLADADLDRAAAEIVSGALTFNGQRCTAIKLVLAERSVAEGLLEKVAARVAGVRVGMPWEDGVVVTPMPDPSHLDYLEEILHDAQERGARIVNEGGGRRAATLLAPAVVYPVTSAMELHRVEQFGPLLPIGVFDHEDEALAALEALPVGQQASIFGRDPRRIGHLVDHLANLVCRVNLNTQCRRGPDSFPFTGRKDSAFGTLSLSDALRVFSVRSLVATPDSGAELLGELRGKSRFLTPGPARAE
jgi:glyceraldehyde-3-phosphate dehydrogenase (NADP+)